MPKWTITDGPDADGPLFEVESLADGMLSVFVPSPHPIIVTRAKAAEIRLALGAALGED